jgi:hypothetical protein
MLRPILVPAIVALGLAASPALTQTRSPAAEEQVNLVGLPVYSSDGERLGEVVEVADANGRRMLQAEFGAFLGLGPTASIIPGEMFAQKTDRIEVSMTAAAVRGRLAK